MLSKKNMIKTTIASVLALGVSLAMAAPTKTTFHNQMSLQSSTIKGLLEQINTGIDSLKTSLSTSNNSLSDIQTNWKQYTQRVQENEDVTDSKTNYIMSKFNLPTAAEILAGPQMQSSPFMQSMAALWCAKHPKTPDCITYTSTAKISNNLLATLSALPLSTTVLPFADTPQSEGNARTYIADLLHVRASQLSSGDLVSAQSMVTEILSRIASENGAFDAAGKSSVSNFQSIGQSLAQLTQQDWVQAILGASPSGLLRVIIFQQLQSNVIAYQGLRQRQLNNAVHAVVLSQLIAIREQNAKLLTAARTRNSYLKQLVEQKGDQND